MLVKSVAAFVLSFGLTAFGLQFAGTASANPAESPVRCECCGPDCACPAGECVCDAAGCCKEDGKCTAPCCEEKGCCGS